MAALVCLLTLAGCGRNYEPVEVPALEEASGDITPENGEETAAVSIEAETGNGKKEGNKRCKTRNRENREKLLIQ